MPIGTVKWFKRDQGLRVHRAGGTARRTSSSTSPGHPGETRLSGHTQKPDRERERTPRHHDIRGRSFIADETGGDRGEGERREGRDHHGDP